MDASTSARGFGAAAAEAAESGPEQYFGAIQDLLSGLVGADLIMWNDIDLACGRVSIAGREKDEWAWLLPHVEATAPENPMVLAFLASRRPQPHRMSDHVKLPDFLNSRLYGDLFRPMGARFQVGMPTRFDGHPYIRGWALNRQSHDFTDAEMGVLRVVQPALNQLEDIICKPRPATGSRSRRADRERLDRLTPREGQVLDLLAEGWTASHMATYLRISKRTVHKHVQNIYDKLGTRDRLLVARRFAAERR